MNFSDSTSTIDELKETVKNFCEERDWDQFHNAKDLAIGVVTEGAELLEPFRFLTEEQVESLMNDDLRKTEISDELADILFFLIRFSQKYDINLLESFSKKMKKNGKRYPASEFKGKNHKAESP